MLKHIHSVPVRLQPSMRTLMGATRWHFRRSMCVTFTMFGHVNYRREGAQDLRRAQETVCGRFSSFKANTLDKARLILALFGATTSSSVKRLESVFDNICTKSQNHLREKTIGLAQPCRPKCGGSLLLHRPSVFGYQHPPRVICRNLSAPNTSRRPGWVALVRLDKCTS
jgi:hypothetical protein